MNKLKRKDNLTWKEIENQIVIIDALTHQRVHKLNSTASFIWKNIDIPREDLLAKMEIEFEGDHSPMSSDLDICLEQLMSLGLLSER